MKNDILLIYPQDKSTDFLQGIPNFLFDKFGEQRFIFRRLGFTEEAIQECRALIGQISLGSFVIFLGHGSSIALMGARTSHLQESVLINRDQISLFQKKEVLFLSCRSSDFLKNQEISGIGFGDLITDMSEVIGRRDHEFDAYRHPKGDIREEDIHQFNEFLVDVVRLSLHDAIKNGLSIQDLYLRLRLRFNRFIFNLIKENKPTDVRWIANLLLEAKTEMKLFLKN